MTSLSGKRALVTGSTQGLGLAIERRLAAAGCDIVLHGLGDPDAIESMSAADWDEDLALPGMKSRKWGRIVNVSSIYGLVGATNRVGYVTTKMALIGLTRDVALETTGYDITCDAVCPDTSATPVHEASLAALRETQNLERDAADGGWSAM